MAKKTFIILFTLVSFLFVTGGTLKYYESGAVATDVQLCSEMGRDILEKGGSAVDGAITSALCVGVVNGQSSGIGGGFFMVIYTRASGIVESLDAQESAQAATYPEMFAGQGPDGAKYGMESVAIPGEVRGMWNAHQKYGKLPWSDLFQPVINISRNGFTVGAHLHHALRSIEDQWDEYPDIRNLYYNAEEGRVAIEGDVITNQNLADTLQAIAENGVEEFYQGHTASKLVQDIQAGGGNITMRDLAGYTAVWKGVEIVEDFLDYSMYTSQLTSNGPYFQFMLRTLQEFNLPTSDNMTSEERILLYHRFIEICKVAFGLRTKLGDTWSEVVEETLEDLRSLEFSRYVRDLITGADPDVFSTSSHDYVIDQAVYSAQVRSIDKDPDVGDTSHISVLAPNGDAVSMTTSVGYYFGCKDASLSTGVILNNHLRNFYFDTKYQTWTLPANQLSPGKRPLSTMGPTVIIDSDGDVKMVIGASGGFRIPTSVLWVILRTLVMNVSLDEAINEPRIHNNLLTNKAFIENGFPQSIVNALQDRGHIVANSSSYGVVQGILRTDDGIAAYSDPRKGGKAAGFSGSMSPSIHKFSPVFPFTCIISFILVSTSVLT
ncbi:glutathione hydrolase 1 proenzyme-like isoform X2 [Lytechinus variegatus]|uniref:glutathione hydrolase 1 proenzyme-like isoform X2 n=1 Tax=Lytechinus variegatus TaxID=7654 RepID=UPI001BB1BFF7|nr:glutathione hydrolase 1 proenzyme-like isoform X2 [Lytechinus variegatus]